MYINSQVQFDVLKKSVYIINMNLQLNTYVNVRKEKYLTTKKKFLFAQTNWQVLRCSFIVERVIRLSAKFSLLLNCKLKPFYGDHVLNRRINRSSFEIKNRKVISLDNIKLTHQISLYFFTGFCTLRRWVESSQRTEAKRIWANGDA